MTVIKLPKSYQDSLPKIAKDKYLPIEDFKDYKSLFKDLGATYFESSGTTQKEKSLSPFSKRGLLAYEKSAVSYFTKILESFFGKDGAQNSVGIFLISPLNETPQWSLSQMADFIAKKYKVYFVKNAKELKHRVKETSSSKPLWIFGTAWQFALLFEELPGKNISTPPRTVVFETGGFKNKVRAVKKEVLYRQITNFFKLQNLNAVVSEYGMCELSSQAYDFVESGLNKDEVPLDQRYFYWPPWVKVRAFTPHNQIKKNDSVGAALIKDMARIDFPFPVRTQDAVYVKNSSTFKLLSRVEGANLKGCSLRVEDILKNAVPSRTPKILKVKGRKVKESDLKKKIAKLSPLLKKFLQDKKAFRLLKNSLGGFENIANWALKDLQSSVPENKTEWKRSFFNAVGGKKLLLPNHVLLILPKTHEIVGLYPLCFLGLFAKKITLKISQKSGPSEFTRFFIERVILKIVKNVEITHEHYETAEQLSQFDQVFVFASDETVRDIQALSQGKIKGFGSTLTASFISRKDLEKEKISKLSYDVSKDILSLMQEGCMSVRSLFLEESKVSKIFLQQVQKHIIKILNESELPVEKNLGIENYITKKQRLGHKVTMLRARSSENIFGIVEQNFSKVKRLKECFLEKSFCLSVIYYKREDLPRLLKEFKRHHELRIFVCSKFFKDFIILFDKSFFTEKTYRMHGKANIAEWNGSHLNEKLILL